MEVGHKVLDRTEPDREAGQSSHLEEDMESLEEDKESLAAGRSVNAALAVAVVRKADVEVDSLVAEVGRVNLLRQHCQLVFAQAKDTQPRLHMQGKSPRILTGLTVWPWRRALVVVAHVAGSFFEVFVRIVG